MVAVASTSVASTVEVVVIVVVVVAAVVTVVVLVDSIHVHTAPTMEVGIVMKLASC